MHTVIVADDLTGAADAAAPYVERGQRVVLLPWRDPGPDPGWLRAFDTDVLVVETDTRSCPPDAAFERLERVGLLLAAAELTPGWVVKKVDSLLRGPIAREVQALRSTLGVRRCVAAPALPALGRRTRGGVQYLDEVPVGRGGGDPRAGAYSPEVARAVGLRTTRTIRPGAPLPADGDVVIDAGSDADLDRVVSALGEPGPSTLLVATSGLTSALARAGRSVTPGAAPPPGSAGAGRSVVVLSLTPAPAARAQVEVLTAVPGTEVVALDVAELLAGAATVPLAQEVAAATARAAVTVVHTVGELPEHADPAPLRAAVLRSIVAVVGALGPEVDVIANGGDATRGVVDAVGADRIDVLAALAAGSVLLRLPDGRRVVTKSGSFGPPTTLADLVAVLAAGPVAVTSPSVGVAR